MKKILFTIAICGFILSSCGNKTKTASKGSCCSKEKAEASEVPVKGCSHGTKAKCSEKTTD